MELRPHPSPRIPSGISPWLILLGVALAGLAWVGQLDFAVVAGVWLVWVIK